MLVLRGLPSHHRDVIGPVARRYLDNSYRRDALTKRIQERFIELALVSLAECRDQHVSGSLSRLVVQVKPLARPELSLCVLTLPGEDSSIDRVLEQNGGKMSDLCVIRLLVDLTNHDHEVLHKHDKVVLWHLLDCILRLLTLQVVVLLGSMKQLLESFHLNRVSHFRLF